MRGDALVTVETETRRLEIHQDEAIESPRDWDNLGTMAFFHKRYDLGDKDHGVNDADYSSWHEMAIGIEKKFDTAVLMPVYMYDHSGLAFSTDGDTYPFNDRWDAGRIGFMFVTKEKARKEYGKLTAKVIEKIKDVLRSELRVYAQYVEGEIYWFSLVDKATDETVDSCGGFYGSDWKTNGITDYISDKEIIEKLVAL
jgi:hypothetical protein